jgi:hypothetical protein
MQDSDDFDGMPTYSGTVGSGSIGSMERISPEDLPGLIRARSEQQTASGSLDSLGGPMGQQTAADLSRLPAYPSLTQPIGDISAGTTRIPQDQSSEPTRVARLPPRPFVFTAISS